MLIVNIREPDTLLPKASDYRTGLDHFIYYNCIKMVQASSMFGLVEAFV